MYEIPEPTNLKFVFKEGDNCRKGKGQWNPKVKGCIREHETDRLWDRSRAGTWAKRESVVYWYSIQVPLHRSGY